MRMSVRSFGWRGAFQLPVTTEGEGAARLRTSRRTRESWAKIRDRIRDRDRSTCHACGLPIEIASGCHGSYACGHIIDRALGGSDQDGNLVAMHALCNQLKPLTPTREDYLRWLDTDPALAVLRGEVSVAEAEALLQ